jgi:putative CocE/NonD family hydrolase
MRDGVVLRADLWRPSRTGRFPTLVYRTPYNKRAADAALSTARKAVARGYAVVLQDVRGRYASDGEFVAYQQEGRDGFDTIEWAAAQSWSTGAIGTYGLSYPGAVQWLAAIENPPHLKAMVPAMTFASPMMFWYSGGVFDNSWIPWIYRNIEPNRRSKLGLPATARTDSAELRMRSALPQAGMRDFERTAPWYYDWLKYPAYDPWWNWAELRGKYGRTNAAVLNFSGWYDEAYGPHGAVNNFVGLSQSRDAASVSRNKLVIGPWQHGVPPMTRTRVGEREFTAAGNVDYDEMVLTWMDRHVRDADDAQAGERAVNVFVLGSNRWVAGDSWPLPGLRADTIVLRRTGDSTRILSDPAKPVVDAFSARYGAHDYRAIAARPDVVVFESAPLASDLTVVGAMRAEIAVSVDAPDTDLWVKVYDVAPDGTAFNLMNPGLDVLRASYRNARPTRELLEPGRVYTLTLGDLFTANTFKRGHRVRVVIMTTFFPHFSRNLHSGDLEAVSSRSRVARVTVHHSARHPSRLILPVLPAPTMFDRPRLFTTRTSP